MELKLNFDFKTYLWYIYIDQTEDSPKMDPYIHECMLSDKAAMIIQ